MNRAIYLSYLFESLARTLCSQAILAIEVYRLFFFFCLFAYFRVVREKKTSNFYSDSNISYLKPDVTWK